MQKAAEVIRNAKNMIALTGAGISVESGIPDFRSAGGLWEKYNPEIYANIESFVRNPVMVWDMLFDMIDLTSNAKPNPAHVALAKLEEMGLLKGIITQNVDNLHQAGGSKNVIEYHGNSSQLECMQCGKLYDPDITELTQKIVPKCKPCDKVLKPTVVFFGEAIPFGAMTKSQALAEAADVVLVVGTSAVVYPCAAIPLIARQNGATIVVFDLEQTALTLTEKDILILGPAGKTLPEVIELIQSA